MLWNFVSLFWYFHILWDSCSPSTVNVIGSYHIRKFNIEDNQINETEKRLTIRFVVLRTFWFGRAQKWVYSTLALSSLQLILIFLHFVSLLSSFPLLLIAILLFLLIFLHFVSLPFIISITGNRHSFISVLKIAWLVLLGLVLTKLSIWDLY